MVSGYTGRNCETDVDECASTPGACLNGGRCQDAVNNFTCDCSGTGTMTALFVGTFKVTLDKVRHSNYVNVCYLAGYTGARCELNVNECEEDRNICGHGVCYDTYGGYVCACQLGYKGERCNNVRCSY